MDVLVGAVHGGSGMTPAEWLHEQTRRYGRVTYYPAKAMHETTWSIMGPDREVVATGLLLGVARARCNRMNGQAVDA